MKFKKLLTLTTLLTITNMAHAEDDPCRSVKWHDTKPLTVFAAMYQHVHITLPSELILEPINNNILWEVSGSGKHIFISPTSTDKLGSTTTISALTEDGNSYDFVVKRSDKWFNPCVNITNKSMLSSDQMSKLKSKRIGNNRGVSDDRELRMLKIRYKKMEENSLKEKEEAVKQAIRKYRFHIYTRYKWKALKNKKSFMSENLLSDVYDDGRFTYLRLSHDNKTLPALEAVINGKPEFIESKYDEVADLYRVVGIYPELSLIYGDDKISIERTDKTTRGEF